MMRMFWWRLKGKATLVSLTINHPSFLSLYQGSSPLLVETSEQTLIHLPPALPSPSSSSHVFSIPLRTIYSLVIQPPTLSSWFGSVTFNLYGGETLPPLWFHDEESRSTVLDRDRRVVALGALGSNNFTSPTTSNDSSPNSSSYPPTPSYPPTTRALPPSWGGESLLSQLRLYSNLIRSQLEPRLFLVNPSRADIEVHSTALYEDEVVPKAALAGMNHPAQARANSSNGGANGLRGRKYGNGVERGNARSILHRSLEGGDEYPDIVGSGRGGDGPTMDNFTFNVLNSFSRITRG